MAPEQKQTELQRHRTILLATLDFLEQHLGGSFVCDQCDPATDYYQQQKIQTEIYFKQRRLHRMQQRLASLTDGLHSRTDLNFAFYIKEKTGYDIEIIDSLRKRVAVIVAQNEISSQKELNDIVKMLHLYRVSPRGEEEVVNQKVLLYNYSKKTNKIPRNRKGKYIEVINRVEKEGIVEETVRCSTGPKPRHSKEQETTSPDGKRKLRVVQWSDGKNDSTYVSIHFPTANGAIYGTSGIHPGIKCRWKDNHTILITTKKYQANPKYKQVRSFEMIRIDF